MLRKILFTIRLWAFHDLWLTPWASSTRTSTLNRHFIREQALDERTSMLIAARDQCGVCIGDALTAMIFYAKFFLQKWQIYDISGHSRNLAILRRCNRMYLIGFRWLTSSERALEVLGTFPIWHMTEVLEPPGVSPALVVVLKKNRLTLEITSSAVW